MARKYSYGPRRRGAVLVEAAMVTVAIVIPLLIGILQFGLYYFATNSLTQSVREGARYAAVYGLDTRKSNLDIKNRVVEVGRQSNLIIDPNRITITPATRTNNDQYKPITVSVTYDMKAKQIIRLYQPGVITRTATMMLE